MVNIMSHVDMIRPAWHDYTNAMSFIDRLTHNPILQDDVANRPESHIAGPVESARPNADTVHSVAAILKVNGGEQQRAKALLEYAQKLTCIFYSMILPNGVDIVGNGQGPREGD